MKKYHCIIVEDEPLAAEVLQDYIAQIPYLLLEAICTDALFALDALKVKKIDLIFLDIHLPKLKGLDFLKTLDHAPHIILTTAYHQYAIEAFDHGVIDYLLKPIEFNRFLKAVEKFYNQQSVSASNVSGVSASIFFNVNKKRIKVNIDDILYIESLKEYVRIVTKEKSLVTKFQLGQIDQFLANSNFVRIHKSFIVAKDKVDAYSATDVEIGGKVIPIGRVYKEVVEGWG
jgi:DNA-binding LytR/AlgR family response regulator